MNAATGVIAPTPAPSNPRSSVLARNSETRSHTNMPPMTAARTHVARRRSCSHAPTE
nr:hypothetical protein [Litorihabitans aurantiacus]